MPVDKIDHDALYVLNLHALRVGVAEAVLLIVVC